MRSRGIAACVTCFLFMWLIMFPGVLEANADERDMRTLLMPGPLTAKHAKEETRCEACHDAFAKEAQDKLCLDCHKDVAADMRGGEGFHGRRLTPGMACVACHSDHRGRDADITALDRESFDHARTDFPLEGPHQAAACAGCHAEGRKWRDAPQECLGCHRDEDRHRGELGEQCADCHTVTAWSDARFDHGKTEFGLEARHAETACASCHPDQRYRDTPTACGACHAISDVHRGRRGENCAACHVADDWKLNAFDHTRSTKFPLRGEHRKVGCAGCHHLQEFAAVSGSACVDCHRGDDVHGGRNGGECARCHSESSWRETQFSHDLKTRFPLLGKHAETRCEACHTVDATAATTPATCVACHRDEDVHAGAEGFECGDCHRESGWLDSLRFDHDLSSFPLLGAHTGQACQSCHFDKAYKGTSTECENCHRQDDRHEAGLGNQCGQCHSPAGWSLWKFDHDTQTEFVLKGAHREAGCRSCHAGPAGSSPLSRECVACHRADDRHRGQFGRDCDQCHSTERFDAVEMLRRVPVVEDSPVHG